MSQDNHTDNASRRAPERSNTNGTRLDVFYPQKSANLPASTYTTRFMRLPSNESVNVLM
ncbi:hypothetical protein BH09BAC4_BH09BAC4_18610 [soil metagenome]